MKTLIVFLALTGVAWPQRTYGSLSRQMTVERNVALYRAETERVKYRKFREEIRRQNAADGQTEFVYVDRIRPTIRIEIR